MSAQETAVEISRLASTLSDIASAGATVELRVGQVHYQAATQTYTVSSGGQPVNVIWNQDIIPYDGANCALLLATTGAASVYFVAFLTGSKPAPPPFGTVTAFTAGQPTCTVQAAGVTYTAQRASSYTPTVGDVALLTFAGNNIYAAAPLTVYTPPAVLAPTVVAPPPPPPQSGNSFIPCQDSGTWTNGYNWNGYFGQNTYSGSGYVPPSSGNWFYNGGTNGLADKTNINAIRFWLGPRRNAGSYNSTVTVHFYTHNASYRGGGEPARIDGPFDVNIPPGWGGDWVALPTSFAATLKAGGGVSLAGDPYVGFTGVGENGNAGALSIDWSK